MPDAAMQMPAVFVGHGSPMNALEENRYTTGWRDFAAGFPRPRAVLAVSAHWFIGAAAVTSMPRPRTIHDFFGFPDELFALQYAAPGSAELAQRVAEVAEPIWIGEDVDSWGLDHGTWSVLTHMYPDADIPVVQLSIDATKSIEEHVALGAALAPLRSEGVLIVGSGNVVHNLGILDFSAGETGAAWAHDFDEAATRLMTESPDEIGRLAGHDAFDLAVPTDDHFTPLLYIAGLAAAAGRGTTPMLEGYLGGSLSMTSHVLAGG